MLHSEVVSLVRCCVSAGVRGAAQSGAEGLRSWLDHRHQSTGGNPHLFAVSCATLEGEPTHEHGRNFPASETFQS